MQQFATNEVDSHPLLLLWLASQRPRQHFLLRCESGRFDSVARKVAMLGVPPVRLSRLPGSLELPPDKRGTLVLNDVAALGLADQIALYDWLGSGAGDLRVISVTTSSLAPLVARGAFLEGLFHRLGAVQFDLTPGQVAQ
jgi:transcriptional regulator of aromatic amino acid metabolism